MYDNIRRLSWKFFSKVTRRLNKLYRIYILRDQQMLAARQWFKIDGDTVLRTTYSHLNENSVVFDLGGYVGDFAHEINKKYGCHVYVFEPHPVYFNKCSKRFFDNKKVRVFPFGLSEVDGKFSISNTENSSSIIKRTHGDDDLITCDLKEIFDFCESENINNIDLMKINIEGAEFNLLEHIIANRKLELSKTYQIQFHNFVDESEQRYDNIKQSFSSKYRLDWSYYFVWESWSLK